MIRLDFANINDLKQTHYSAIKSYVFEIMPSDEQKAFYDTIKELPELKNIPFEEIIWLEKFILADVNTLRKWTINYSQYLQFDAMKKLYQNRFAKSEKVYVDKAKTYNAYTLFRMMNIKVCPYCEHEYLDEVAINGQARRTVEFDHFFPKGTGEFPGLAMCFYNLIPSCKPCNQLKSTGKLSANPYDEDIETLTCLYPDLPPGILMDTVSIDQCTINFHESGGMIQNNKTLALQQRYSKISHEVHQLLHKRQQYPIEKLEELERIGAGSKDEWMCTLFGNPRDKAKGIELHTKMKQDLINY